MAPLGSSLAAEGSSIFTVALSTLSLHQEVMISAINHSVTRLVMNLGSEADCLVFPKIVISEAKLSSA
eukprot:m.199285 g.199285  ORF g.199285 m.199285 type:complete len:68 (-) comp15314_c0_seq1:5-208(-)